MNPLELAEPRPPARSRALAATFPPDSFGRTSRAMRVARVALWAATGASLLLLAATIGLYLFRHA